MQLTSPRHSYGTPFFAVRQRLLGDRQFMDLFQSSLSVTTSTTDKIDIIVERVVEAVMIETEEAVRNVFRFDEIQGVPAQFRSTMWPSIANHNDCIRGVEKEFIHEYCIPEDEVLDTDREIKQKTCDLRMEVEVLKKELEIAKSRLKGALRKRARG
jgi:hypothetical protein